MTAVLIIVIVLMVLGCFFALTAGVGMLRMPDFYTRLHPAGKADTAAQMAILTALLVMAIAGPPADESAPPTEADVVHGGYTNSGTGDDATAPDDAAHGQVQTQAGDTDHTDGQDSGDHAGGHGAHFGNQAPDIATAIKIVLIIAFLVITAPTATHAITKAAWLGKLQPWMNDESRANEAKANAESLDTLTNMWISTTGIRHRRDVEGSGGDDAPAVDENKEDS